MSFVAILVLGALALWTGQNVASFTNVRLLINSATGLVLLLLAVGNVRRGALALLAWLPFMGFQRRLIYVWEPYTFFDPILLIGPAISVLLGGWCFLGRRQTIREMIQTSPTARSLTLLLLLFVLQIGNPLQGGIKVGLEGALFYIIPVLWFYIGAVFFDERTVARIAGTVIGVTAIAAAYYLYQDYWGLHDFEMYWVEHGGWGAGLQLPGGRIRSFSVFVSPSEFGMYAVGGMLAIVAKLVYQGDPRYVPIIALGFWALFIGGGRGGIVVLFVGILVLFALRKRRPARGMIVAIVSIIGLILVLGQVKYEEGMFGDIGVPEPIIERQVRGLSDPFGEYSSVPNKIGFLTWGFWNSMTHNPLGHGLGSTTLAVVKHGVDSRGTEMDISDVFQASGVLGGLLYVYIIYRVFKQTFQVWLRWRGWVVPAGFGLMVAAVNKGVSGGNYVLPLIFWAVAGWLDREWRDLAIAEEGKGQGRG
ncbi:MAG: O-antigen ligase family protein [Candidatus Rokubacteria bacterium]|nr:O-antigen ligase family protein [Candidatus Rokubacteria bacterium]